MMDFETHVPLLIRLLRELVTASPFPFEEVVPSALPPRPGVYRIFETSLPADTIYVGRTVSLRDRIYGSHLMGNEGVSTLKRKLLKQGRYPVASDVKAYLRHDCSVQYLIIETAVERLRLEHFAIALLRPWYNNQVRDPMPPNNSMEPWKNTRICALQKTQHRQLKAVGPQLQ